MQGGLHPLSWRSRVDGLAILIHFGLEKGMSFPDILFARKYEVMKRSFNVSSSAETWLISLSVMMDVEWANKFSNWS
jgi:hypothetical protein